MDTNIYTNTQTHGIHCCKRERERKGGNQNFSGTINSNWTFTDTNSGIKKTVVTRYNQRNTQINHLLLEDHFKYQKHVLKK